MQKSLILEFLEAGRVLTNCAAAAMEAYDHHDPCESSSFCKDEERVEVVDDLLEECWFFQNLLDRKPRMARCFSDPCPSSSSNIADQIVSKITDEEQLPRSNLLRTPSLPPNIGRELEGSKEKHRHSRRSKLTRQSSHKLALQTTTREPPCLETKGGEKGRESDGRKSKTTTGHDGHHSLQRNLLRTPSLPPNIGRTELMYHHQDEEIDPFTIAKSSHQTSPNLADILPRPPHKGIPRCRPPRNTEMVEGIIDTDGCKEMRRRYLSEGKLSMRKSLNDLEIEEVQGFKDLGFTFENKDLSPSVVNIIPGLQDKEKKGINEDLKLEKVRRPYLSEAWMLQSCAPQFPNWDDIARRRSSEDMKAQIKFWARAVASNVR